MHVHSGELAEARRHLGDRYHTPTRDVVNLAWLSSLRQQAIRPHDVADVCEVPPGLEVAYPDGSAAGKLCFDDPSGQA